MGRREGNRPVGKPRRRCEDNTKMDQEVGWGAWTRFMWLGMSEAEGFL
jgi:hypothetical protein